MKKITIQYRQTKRHRKLLTIDVDATTIRKAELAFRQEHPDAVIISIEPKMSADIVAIKDMIDTAHALKSAIFWEGGNRAKQAWTEKRYSRDVLEWWEGGDYYTAWIDVSCTWRHVYVRKGYHKNGECTTLTAIKSSYRRLKEMNEAQQSA